MAKYAPFCACSDAFPDRTGMLEMLTRNCHHYLQPGGKHILFTAGRFQTDGLPVAIAAKLLLTGKIPITGCHIPTHPAVYEPVLQELRGTGLEFKERVESIT